jgi:hypothetical protein
VYKKGGKKLETKDSISFDSAIRNYLHGINILWDYKSIKPISIKEQTK